MSFEFHHNKPEYFRQQYENARKAVVPFITQNKALKPGMQVLEIGCAEGGVLKAFTELDCVCTGVELSPSKIESAHKFMASEVASKKIQFICQNIYDVDFQNAFKNRFDVIILKDTIEHIPDQLRLLHQIRNLLADEGVLFVGFPPWFMPWGGHQQICKSKLLMYLPWFHLLPMPLFIGLLKMMGELPYKVQEMVEIKETGISTTTFERFVIEAQYVVLQSQFYVVNPIYKFKFGWRARKQWKWMSKLPYLRDILSTTVYYNLAKA